MRDPAGSGRDDTFPTAANIVGAITNPFAGLSFKFYIKNTADAAENISLSISSGHGSGTTFSHSQNLSYGQHFTGNFLAVLTNVTSGSEAVTIYNIGTSF